MEIGKVEVPHPQGREKVMNPGYPGHASNGKDAPTATYHAATVSGPCISPKQTVVSGHSFGEYRELNS